MRKRWWFSLMGALALLPLGGSAPSLADPFPLQTGYTCQGTGSTSSDGIPAIQPHLHAIPAYTADDVRRYIQHNGVPGADGPVTILKILFITSAEVCERTRGESTGLAPDALVCFVELKGTFYPILWIGGTPPSSPYAYQVYDARTGNLIMFSG